MPDVLLCAMHDAVVGVRLDLHVCLVLHALMTMLRFVVLLVLLRFISLPFHCLLLL